uniref:Uncharacterized protein n=1 Tax=Physcomitrium patens TaxID=3218 RepID=A0A2K1LAL3_PHYPA|nr:hypothetical protein PHYPA_001490 [Physcomitrium patens]
MSSHAIACEGPPGFCLEGQRLRRKRCNSGLHLSDCALSFSSQQCRSESPVSLRNSGHLYRKRRGNEKWLELKKRALKPFPGIGQKTFDPLGGYCGWSTSQCLSSSIDHDPKVPPQKI